MANQFNIPFNYKPVETTVETTTYSLAAGKYARVIPTKFDDTLSIDGESVFPKLQGVAIASSNSTVYTNALSNDTKYPMVVNWATRTTGGGTGTSGIRSANGYLITTNYGGTILGASEFSTTSASYVTDTVNYVTDSRLLMPGQAISYKSDNVANDVFIEYSYATITSPDVWFWANGGDSGITITGDTFVIELYNSYS